MSASDNLNPLVFRMHEKGLINVPTEVDGSGSRTVPEQIHIKGVKEPTPAQRHEVEKRGGEVYPEEKFVHSHLSAWYARATPEKTEMPKMKKNGEPDFSSLSSNFHALRGEQLRLFEHHPAEPASYVVTGFYSTKDARVGAMTSLGILANQANKHGVIVTPSDDLSRHSLNLVNKLNSMGAIDKSAYIPKAPTNDIDFEEKAHLDWVDPTLFREVSHGEATAGRQRIRDILKSRPKESDQSNVPMHKLMEGQPTLFD